MSKYRIIEVQRECGTISYVIQKKFWFMWWDLGEEYMDMCSSLLRGEYKTYDEAKNKLDTTFKCRYKERTVYEKIIK